MKKSFLLILLMAFLASCSTNNPSTPGGDPTEGSNNVSIVTPENPDFQETTIANFATDDLSDFRIADGYGNGTPFGNTWSKSCVEIEDGVLKLSNYEIGIVYIESDKEKSTILVLGFNFISSVSVFFTTSFSTASLHEERKKAFKQKYITKIRNKNFFIKRLLSFWLFIFFR